MYWIAFRPFITHFTTVAWTWWPFSKPPLLPMMTLVSTWFQRDFPPPKHDFPHPHVCIDVWLDKREGQCFLSFAIWKKGIDNGREEWGVSFHDFLQLNQTRLVHVEYGLNKKDGHHDWKEGHDYQWFKWGVPFHDSLGLNQTICYEIKIVYIPPFDTIHWHCNVFGVECLEIICLTEFSWKAQLQPYILQQLRPIVKVSNTMINWMLSMWINECSGNG